MPYAAEGRISRELIDGGIEISAEAYDQALTGMLEGLHVQIVNGALFVGPLPETAPDPVPDPTPDEIKAERLAMNNAAYEAATMALTSDYPQLEKDTWPTQDEETKAWIADPAAAVTPWIDQAASERGIPREEYLRRTLVKSRQFKLLSSFLTGRRQRFEDEIKVGGAPALDYELTQEILAQLQQIAVDGMSRPAGELKGVM